jgi:hypothetical protein
MKQIPFTPFAVEDLQKSQHPGTTGMSIWNTMQMDGLRIRRVIYEPGYLADHWCQKGHIVFVIRGSVINELEVGEKTLLTEGMGYVVSDDMSSHRSFSEHGAELLIVDGEFLKITP